MLHLSRLFRRHVGIPFREYAQNVRLDRAVRQLRQSSQSISEIAIEEGFSGSLFYARFRDRFGCTPAEYRRSISVGDQQTEGPNLYQDILLDVAEKDDSVV